MDKVEKKMSLVEHLYDLRKSLVASFLSLAVGTVVGYLNVPLLFIYLKKPLFIDKLIFISPTEAFLVKLKLALLVGLIIALPVITASAGWFIAPGLTSREKKIVSILALVSFFLFCIGAAVAYLAALPLVLKLLFQLTPDVVIPYISVNYYFSFVLNFIFLFGLSFQFPILIMVLALLGIAKKSFWQGKRRYVILLLISLSFLLAPTADIFTQSLLILPLYILFEITIFIIGFIPKKKLSLVEVKGSGK